MYNSVFIINAFFYAVAAIVAGYAITQTTRHFRVLLILTVLICIYFCMNYLMGFFGILSVERFSENLRMVSSGMPIQIAGYIVILLVLLKGRFQK